MKDKKQSQSSNPWTDIGRIFSSGFPFNGTVFPSNISNMPEWIERVVQQSLPPTAPSVKKELYAHNVFETHKSIVVRIQLPNSVMPELLRVYVGATSLRVDGFPNQAEKRIMLPCEVNKHGIRSTYKDGILEIRMVKKQSSDQERQINVTIL